MSGRTGDRELEVLERVRAIKCPPGKEITLNGGLACVIHIPPRNNLSHAIFFFGQMIGKAENNAKEARSVTVT